MSGLNARAGIVVTGTEVLTGRVADANGPWLSERLTELGIDHAHTIVVGDRPDDLRAALEFLARLGVELIVTSGGLGPTEDDLTASVVAEFSGRDFELDERLEARIATILEKLTARWPDLDLEAVAHGNRKQAMVPDQAAVLEPVGTAPGFVVTPAEVGKPTVVVLPGPPGELRPMWKAAVATDEFRAAVGGLATEYRSQQLLMFGIPESEIAETLRVARARGVDLDALEVTTCLRRGEVEVVTRWEPPLQPVYDAFLAVIRERHADTIFSDDGTSIDDQVAALLSSRALTIATAESCTGGLLAGRLTERAGSSAYVLGGLVVYANEAKTALAGVDASLIEAHGAVSTEVAFALARGAAAALGADVGVGITGVAGPGGGTEEKPVGTVCFSVCHGDASLTRRLQLPGSRADVRDRSTTVALHMVRRLLLGEHD
ncbi:MAG TPA: competence/damage-inducible protein A [Solirubrobacteraceae bacterium]|nr:competence/damage-inducible protein A [Solirubrobacteraceae bacterium]